MKIGDWLKGHKPEAALGAGGIAVTLFLAYRARQNAAASGSSSTSSGLLGGLTGSSTAVPVSTADTTSSDAFNGIEDQVLGLQQAVLGIQSGTPAAAPATPASTTASPAAPTDPYANEGFQGSGYGVLTGGLDVSGKGSSGSYTEITDPGAAGGLLRSGTTLDYQPGEGIFEPVTASSNLAPGTPLFVKDPSQ